MAIKGFEDVNAELVEIRKIELLVDEKRVRADAAIQAIQKRLEEETQDWLADIKGRKAAIEKFCRRHFDEFGGKSKKFDAGTVLFRDDDMMVIADEAATLKRLAKYYPDGFAVKRSIDKIALKKLGVTELQKLGVERFTKSVCAIRTVKE